MKIEDIEKEYDIDCKISADLALDRESMRIPELHNKYLKMRTRESVALRELQVTYEKDTAYKTLFLTGKLSDEDYQHTPLDRKVAKVELPTYLAIDNDLNKLKLFIEIQTDKVKMLDDIVRSINNRTYLIGHIIKWKLFEAGVNG